MVGDWHKHKYSVICLQETRLDAALQAQVEDRLRTAAAVSGCTPFRPFWFHNPAGRAAGVGILVRADLIDSGELRVGDPHFLVWVDAPPASHPLRGGRCMAVRLTWSGHSLHLVNVYAPNKGDHTAAFLARVSDFIQDLPRGVGGGVALVGDFNFVEHPADRCSSVALGGPVRVGRGGLVRAGERLDRGEEVPGSAHLQPVAALDAAERSAAAAMHALCQRFGLVDAYRQLHPTPARCYTHFHPHGASRLDRIYISRALLPHTAACRPDFGSGLSDHRPVLWDLRPSAPPAGGPPPPPPPARVRVRFARTPALVASFADWAAAQLGAAPSEPAALVDWWPAFKRGLFQKLRELNAAALADRPPSAVREQEDAQAALAAAVTRLEDHPVPTVGHLAQVLEASTRARRATTALALPAAMRAHATWLRDGERPSPGLTAMVHFHQPSVVGGWAAPGGGLTVQPAALARIAVEHFAAVSSAPPQDAQAQARVLAAVHAHAQQITPASAQGLGSRVVRPDEVRRACKHSRPGTSPGPDGLPGEVWRLGGGVLQPLLVRLFCAVASAARVPQGFTHGVIKVFLKPGRNPTQPGSYRPITLLNSDYRILAKLHATRLSRVLHGVLGLHQTAFLPGRRIGDNISFLQLLPHALRAQHGRPQDGDDAGAVAFLDFRCAYDTVDRGFLRQALQATGAGPFVHWVDLLLGDCQATAVVNGAQSAPRMWHAGVRQGCPLSPVLYLVVAWALHCWLLSCPALGLRVGGTLHVALEFADDAQALVRGCTDSAVRPLLDHLQVFEHATGQGLNAGKCALLPVGCVPAGPLPAAVCGIPVVTQATALGIPFANDDVDADWPQLLERVKTAYARLAPLHLSTFGRAAAASSYGVSKVLFAAEFSGMPVHVATTLHSLTRALVDRGVGPPSPGVPPGPNKPPGVPSALLSGSPAEGGFGALPWQPHVQARHAVWAGLALHSLTRAPAAELPPAQPVLSAEALRALPLPARRARLGPRPTLRPHGASPLWTPLLACVLRAAFPHHHPAWALLGMARVASVAPPRPLPEVAAALPGLVRRWVAALRALGPALDVLPQPLVLGPWCAAAPTWGCPQLDLESPRPLPPLAPGVAPYWRAPIAQGFGELQPVPLLRALSGLRPLLRLSQDPVTRLPVRVGTPAHHQLQAMARAAAREDRGVVSGLMADMAQWDYTVTHLWRAVPEGWRQHLAAGVPAGVTEQGVVAMLSGRLGWRGFVGQRGVVLPLAMAWRVRDVLPLLLGDAPAVREARWHVFASDALHLPLLPQGVLPRGPPADGPRVAAAVRRLRATLPGAWRLRWDNACKDTWWRLTVQGVRGAGGHDLCLGPCVCGWQPPPVGAAAGAVPAPERARAVRAHAFWCCPVARAVVQAVQGGLPGGVALRGEHLWLARTPSPGVVPGVWLVVCLAALTAMHSGGRYLWKLHMAAEERGPRQQTLNEAFGLAPPPPLHVERAGRWAVGHFWSLLAGFAELHRWPHHWPAGRGLSPGHAFLAADPDAPLQATVRAIRLVPPVPPALAVPAAPPPPAAAEAAAGPAAL